MQILPARLWTTTGLTYSGLFFEWLWMTEKRAAVKELERLLPDICDLLGVNINDNLTIWVRKHGALSHVGSFYSRREKIICLSLAEIDIICPRIWYFKELQSLFQTKINWRAFTLAHELAHHYQHTHRMLDNFGHTVHWNGAYYDSITYADNHFDKPWERDANERAKYTILGLINRGLM